MGHPDHGGTINSLNIPLSLLWRSNWSAAIPITLALSLPILAFGLAIAFTAGRARFGLLRWTTAIGPIVLAAGKRNMSLAAEVRLLRDGLGLTEKGRHALRWRLPTKDDPQLAPVTELTPHRPDPRLNPEEPTRDN